MSLLFKKNTLMPLLILLSLLAITISTPPAHQQLTITRNPPTTAPSSSCQLHIRNSHEILDIKTNCKEGNTSAAYQQLSKWINTKSAYFIKQDSEDWLGYRYFKAPTHYKFNEYNLSEFKLTLEALLLKNEVSLQLQFQDRYEMELYYHGDDDSWIVASISIRYLFHPLPQIQALSNHHFSYSNNNQTSKSSTKSFLTRKLTGKGLHQLINITLHLDLLTEELIQSNSCYLVVNQILPESTYIDFDQLRTVKKYEMIDIEKPEYASKQYFYEYTISLSKFKQNQIRTYSYAYPIHFRYPKPSELNYTTIPLHPADSLLLNCKNATVMTLEEDIFANRGSASIFNGSSRDSRLVSIITFILMIVGAMVFIKKLKKE